MINNNCKNVTVPCIECGCPLRFHIENEVVIDGEGRIAINVPCAVCSDCVESLLEKVPDPPGLIIFEGLSLEMAGELLRSFTFLLPRREAVDFFRLLFPEIEKPN